MFGIVINKEGFKVAFVVLNEDKTPQYYDLQDGEQIIETDWAIANSMNKPKWDGSKWIDTDLLPPVEPPIKDVDKTDILEQQLINTQMLCIGLQKQIILK